MADAPVAVTRHPRKFPLLILQSPVSFGCIFHSALDSVIDAVIDSVLS
jgi:hypothetical protein